MKKITTTFALLLLLTGYAGAQQQIANAGFESWDTIGDYTQPSKWFTLNPLTTFGYDPSTTISSDAHSGNFAVLLESLAGPNSNLSGVLCTGPILTPNLQPDFSKMKVPFTSKPQALEVYFKSFPEPGDTCIMAMYLTRWNMALQKTDTIAEAGIRFGDTVGVYTLASSAFEYSSPLPPDSMFIIISSSADGFNPTVGSKLLLDDFHLTYTTGLSDVNAVQFSVYPNPANTKLVIESEESEGIISLYSIMGTLVLQQNMDAKQTVLDVSGVADGMYMMMVQSADGVQTSRKINIQH